MSGSDVVERLTKAELFRDLLERTDRTVTRLHDGWRAGFVGQPEQRTKAIKCSLWGMIPATQQELAVIDSPVFQRLRRIRQLGLSFVTYPTAVYSRFEHSLGAMHQAERMLRGVWAHEVDDPGIVERNTLRRIRLAALLHDVGHLPLSHVSERYYDVAECRNAELAISLKRTRIQVAEVLQVKGSKLAECLSLAVMLCPTFRAFLVDQCRYDPEDVAVAALAVVGRPTSPDDAFVAQLMSNAIDADKLDYMFRDAAATGIPLAVDLERLLFKIRGMQVNAARLPDGLKQITGAGERWKILGIDVGGAKALHELAVSRGMLYERVYLHQKTRGAERLALDLLGELQLHPADLLEHGDGLLLDEYRHQPGSKGYMLARALSNRELPRRAFAISFGFLTDRAVHEGSTLRVPHPDRKGWESLLADCDEAARRLHIQRAIADEASRIAGALSIQGPVSIWLDTPLPMSGDNDPEFMLQLPDGDVRLAREIPSFPQIAASLTGTPAGTSYVYATGNDECRAVVFVATERVLALTYGLWFAEGASINAKVSRPRIEDIKRRLEQAAPDYFSGVRDLRPVSAIARRHAIAERIERQASRFRSFQTIDNHRIDAETITRFLDQFPEWLVEPALSLLEEAKFFDRASWGPFSASLSGRIVPLVSAPGKSATHASYFIRNADLSGKVSTLTSALKSADSTITLFDDCQISGKQARTVVQSWLGAEPDLPGDVPEIDVGTLDAEARSALRRKFLQFRFVYGSDEGMSSLRALLKEHGLSGDVHALHHESLSTSALDGEGRSALKDFLREVGAQVLASTKGKKNRAKWTTERCNEFALGYGDCRRLVVFSYNTPTGTLTSLWRSGTYRGQPWMPLFPRSDRED